MYAQLDYLEFCPNCGHTVIQLTRINDNYEISTIRKTNTKARNFLKKIRKEIIKEKNTEKVISNKYSNFYLYYNEFGKIKKCYSNLSSLKLGLFENKECNS